MGTYTANYNLYMPTIGETGWGELINGNYQTIDTTMKSFSNRIGTLETNISELDSRIDAVETGTNKVPILGTFTATNKGYGVILPSNSNSHTIPVGFSFTNPNEIQGSVTLKIKSTRTDDDTVPVTARNVITGATRSLGSILVPRNTTTTFQFSDIRYGEYLKISPPHGYISINSVVRSAIYMGTP